MDISPYESVIEVPVGNGGVVTMRTSIPGAAREHADKLRVKVVTSAKAKTLEDKASVQDMEVQTEMDEPAYNLAILKAFIVGWNLTRAGAPIPLNPDPVKERSIAGLPDTLYTPLLAKAKELLAASARPADQKAEFRGGGTDGGTFGEYV